LGKNTESALYPQGFWHWMFFGPVGDCFSWRNISELFGSGFFFNDWETVFLELFLSFLAAGYFWTNGKLFF